MRNYRLIARQIIEPPIDGNHGEKHPTSDDYVASGIPFLMASNIVDGRADLEHCKYISPKTAGGLTKGFAKNGDVLLTHKATVGSTAILDNLVTEYAVLTPQVTYYRVIDDGKLYSGYLKGYFDSDVFQKAILKIAGQSTRNYVGITAQHDLPFILPSLEEQRLIADFLSDFDEAIAAAKKELELWKELKKGLLQQMFI